MNNKHNVFFICLFVFFLKDFRVSAQNKGFKYGNVDEKDFSVVSFKGDSTYSAIILFDKGKSEINYDQHSGWSLVHERHTRIKILNTDGLGYGDVSISLFQEGSRSEQLSSFKANTFNLVNGKINGVKLKKKEGFEEKVEGNWSKVKFSLPDIKVGSIIEFQYTIRSDFFSHLRDWQFQYSVPSLISEYEVGIPEYFRYERLMQGVVPMVINTHETSTEIVVLTSRSRGVESVTSNATGGKTSQSKVSFQKEKFHWRAENIPPFMVEPYMTSRENYISQIEFELSSIITPGTNKIQRILGTWSDINAALLTHSDLGQRLKGASFLENDLKNIVKGLGSDELKIEAIYNYVRSKVRWNKHYGKYASSSSLKDLMERGEGNSADINLLLLNLLRQAEIKANPVVISTRDAGFVKREFPLARQFNYVIAQVETDKGGMLIDATDPSLPFYMLPERALNFSGLVLKEEGHSWINITPKGTNFNYVSADINVKENGELNGEINVTYRDYAASLERRVLNGLTESELKDKESERFGLSIKNLSIQGLDVINEDVKVNMNFETNKGVEDMGDIMFIDPFIIPHHSENPFKRKSRSYPVDYGVNQRFNYFVTLTIPDNYELDEIPQNKAIALPEGAGSFRYIFQVKGNTISLRCQFNILKPLFIDSEYESLREFYSQVIEAEGQQIVLKKSDSE